MKYRILTLAVICVCMAAGCGEKKGTVMGPEETVEAFCRAVAAGRFDEARAYCDTMAMKTYMDEYAGAWEMLEREDSAATAIAAASLAEAVFTVDGIAKDGDTRLVSYTIHVGKDMSKKKTATVRKTEEAWKVEKITDSL